ncbi:MAG: hypothetical protein E7Z92_00805 [Cyanobacteria bacterium SIG31]|nr:hypothetical protein [Cyanobacteria bacterium SIG31]
MQVHSINKGYNSKPNFKSWSREVTTRSFLGDKIIKHRNDSWFFRDAEFWPIFTEYLVERFKNVPKVNVYSYGCSDGSEPFSFVMRMLSAHPKESSKFLPVIAKDYDKEAINKVEKREYYTIKGLEKNDIDFCTNKSFNRFFNIIDSGPAMSFAFAKDELYDNVQFSVADIRSDYKKIEPNNSVVFVRNFWPYIENWSDRQKLLKKLGDQLGENSFLVIGFFDRKATCWTIDNQVIEAGFKRTLVDFVFEKDCSKNFADKKVDVCK